jgi:hypothetical protein
MGIMPVDRELKWQRIFRRFGLPGDMPEKDAEAKDQERKQQDGATKSREREKPPKPR